VIEEDFMQIQSFGFRNFKIGTKLVLSFTFVLALLVLLTAVGVGRVGKINGSLQTISDVNGVKERYAINFRGSVHNRAIALRDVVLEADRGAVQVQLNLNKKLEEDYMQSAEPLDKMFASRSDITSEERSALTKIKEIETRSVPVVNKVIELRNVGNVVDSQNLLLNEARPIYSAWLDAINVLIDLEEKMNQTESLNARLVAGSFQTLMVVLTLSALVLTTGVVWGITRSVVVPIRFASEVARAVAAGDLTVQIGETSKDESGQLLSSLKEMKTALSSIVANVRTNATCVANASTEIASGNSDLSSRTEQQADAVEQTNAAMLQLSSTVNENAGDAKHANALSKSASEIALRGGQVVNEVVATMTGISESSKKIASIISVIDGIAFQTNILALNAAVEAARAGEQGRGFAVVASEVRSLAGRSASAAREIKDLISASVERVVHGTSLVGQAGTTMTEIVGSIQAVETIISKISAASIEQSNAVQEVGDALNRIDETTQQNAALVEESAAAAGSLRHQADQLVSTMALFKLQTA
jgi:methyl-accepting chemotaxis protein